MTDKEWLYSDFRTWTEAEWKACTHPWPMGQLVQTTASDRKLRLFAVACCRRIWHLLTDNRSKEAIEIAERFADNLSLKEKLVSAHNMSWTAVEAARPRLELPASATSISAVAAYESAADFEEKRHIPEHVVWSCGGSAALALSHDAMNTQNSNSLDKRIGFAMECNVVREIFGNPFNRIAIDPKWLTSTVIDLARAIYNDRAFDRVPILADALMDAGCDQDEIISHCRNEGPHVRGCWVVDKLLGKE